HRLRGNTIFPRHRYDARPSKRRLPTDSKWRSRRCVARSRHTRGAPNERPHGSNRPLDVLAGPIAAPSFSKLVHPTVCHSSFFLCAHLGRPSIEKNGTWAGVV